jgi:hypothetical protein
MILRMGPDFRVYRRCRKHGKGIKRALPDVVDLLHVSMEGGLSYDGAVGYVVAKVMLWPMILLIFPAVFSIIVGPIVLVFMKSFGL